MANEEHITDVQGDKNCKTDFENYQADHENDKTEVKDDAAVENSSDDVQFKIKKLEDQLLRTIAELQNVQKRSEKERTDTAKFAITKFAKDMLTVFDSLQLALTNCKDQENPIVEGVKLTLSQINKIFASYDIKMIESQGEKFDPNYHQAMNQVENEAEKGTVVAVLQEGFMIKDRLLRPALVSVAK